MDTLTHIVLGACIGEAIAGKKLGKKALFLGAFANSIPDLDFIASFWLPTTRDLLSHRAFTHSFIFVLLITPLLAYLSRGIFRKQDLSLKHWLLFWGLEVFVHIFIDAFNAYGTAWFEPFSHYRVSFNTMYVADPLYSIWPAIAFISLLILKKDSAKRNFWVNIGLITSSVYLFLGILFKQSIEYDVRYSLTNQHKTYYRNFTTPTPLNNLLWYAVAESDSGFYIGYRSLFDHNANMKFHFDAKNSHLLENTTNKSDMENLIKFSNGYYTADMWHDTLVFNDLRFGEMNGWNEDQPRCAFHFFLNQPENNKMIVQRGRFAKWNKESLWLFLKRIKGV